MSQAGVLCLCALVLLVLFATCSAVRFPRRGWSQALFEMLGVLCVAFFLALGAFKSIPPEAFFRKTPRPQEQEPPPAWWEQFPNPYRINWPPPTKPFPA